MSKLDVSSSGVLFEPDRAAPADIRRHFYSISVLYVFFEFGLIGGVGFSANYAYGTVVLHWTWPWQNIAFMAVLLSFAIVGAGLLKDEYRRCATLPPVAALWSGFNAASQGCALFLLILFALRPFGDISRGSVLCQFAVVAGAVTVGRAAFNLSVRRGLSSGLIYFHRAMILGDPSRLSGATDGSRFLRRLRDDGVEVARMKALRAAGAGDAEKAALARLVDDCRSDGIDTVIVIPAAETIDYAERLIRALSEAPVTVHVLPFASMSESTLASNSIGGQPSIAIAHVPMDRLNKALKRATDITLASLILLLSLPLWLVVACAIKLESPGPVIFRQTRHGYGNRFFSVYKFRSMRVMEDGDAFRQAAKSDSRITRVGEIIRRSNLDELPQLINVIIGDMSLVGPRPHPVALNESFESQIRCFHRRHTMTPGITGWAQVNGFRGETDTDDKMRGRIEHDLWYIDHWSLALDLWILCLTLFSPQAYRNAG